MASKTSEITPGFKKQSVIISVNALVDLDVGMYKLIKEEYLDPNIFNAEFLNNASIIDFIQTSYFRKEDNLLVPISVINDYQLLDEYCAEFINTEYQRIYDKATYTDILGMIDLFLDSKEVDVTVIYYNEYVRDQLINDIKEGTISSKVGLLDANALKNPIVLNKYNQFYFRSIYELDELPLNKLTSPKNFYISTFRPNFDDKCDFKHTKALETIMTGQLANEIHIFSIYNIKNIKKPEGDIL